MITERKKVIRSKADIAWKNAIEEFFPELIELCFPSLYSIIDWSAGWEFLDKEFAAIAPDNEAGNRFVDKLIRVRLLNSCNQWLRIHLEVQGNGDEYFLQRVFIYHYRIFDQYGEHPITCAILTDTNKSWRPTTYTFKLDETELKFKFHMLKLIDFESQREILEKSSNPFAAIIIIQLNAIKLKKTSASERLRFKIREIKNLFAKGFTKEKLKKLFFFLDALICLPPDLKLKFRDELFQIEKEKNMEYYMSSIEEIGFEKGIQQGMEQGMEQGMQQGMEQGIYRRSKEIAVSLLKKGQSIDLIADVTGLNKTELIKLRNQVTISDK